MQKVIAFALTAALPALVHAQSADIKAPTPYSAYVQSSNGNVVKNAFGQCWHTGYWTPADSVIGCDGDLVPPIASPIMPTFVAQTTPTPVAPPPPPPAPPKPCDFTFVLKADETFTFDLAKLSDAAKHGLDTDFRTKLASCATVQGIVVTGYTDRLGSDSYNLTLSQKRAEAVAEYLKSIGVAGSIEQHGLGKANEIEACAGVKGQTKLIKCLAPNRRVTILVHGLAN